MICRRCGESNYSRVQKRKFERMISYLIPLYAYECNMCRNRFRKFGFQLFSLPGLLLLAIPAILVYYAFGPQISSYINSLNDTPQTAGLLSDDSDQQPPSQNIDVEPAQIDEQAQLVEQDLADEANERLDQQVNDDANDTNESRENDLQAQANDATEAELRARAESTRIAKQENIDQRLSGELYQQVLSDADEESRAALEQCIVNQQVIMFDDDTNAFYDDDELVDYIALQPGSVMIHLALPGVGPTDVVHFEYPIPEEYTGERYNFLFLDQDSDGSIDNKIFAFPKYGQFPMNLCLAQVAQDAPPEDESEQHGEQVAQLEEQQEQEQELEAIAEQDEEASPKIKSDIEDKSESESEGELEQKQAQEQKQAAAAGKSGEASPQINSVIEEKPESEPEEQQAQEQEQAAVAEQSGEASPQINSVIEDKPKSEPEGEPKSEQVQQIAKFSETCPNINADNPFDFEFNDEIESNIDWVLSMPREDFTLQLYADPQLSHSKEFIEQHKLQDKAVVFPALTTDKVYYKVVLGSYPTISEAKDHIDGLPEAVRELKPWIRRFSTYYTEISALTSRICP